MREPSHVYILEGGDSQRAGLTAAGGRGKMQQPYPIRSSRAGVLEFVFRFQVLEVFRQTSKQTNVCPIVWPTNSPKLSCVHLAPRV
jgi:hypothetical protein